MPLLTGGTAGVLVELLSFLAELAFHIQHVAPFYIHISDTDSRQLLIYLEE